MLVTYLLTYLDTYPLTYSPGTHGRNVKVSRGIIKTHICKFQ